MASFGSTIPTISLLQDEEIRARECLTACVQYGFFYLTDLPIEPAKIDQAWQAGQSLFLSEGEQADAQRNASRDRQGHTGYTAVYEEKLDTGGGEIVGDKKESFYIASPLSRQTLPSMLEAYEGALEEVMKGCQRICRILLETVALALGLDDRHYFVDRHTGHDDRLRLIHYPPSALQTAGIRAGAHTDYGSFTVLFQKDVSGLQVLLDGAWQDVAPPQPGTAVVNVADALEFWTGGLLRSAQHRVVMPRTQGETGSRFSIAFFCQPDADADLTPIAKSLSSSRTAQEYHEELRRKGITSATAALTGGQHLQARLRASYGP